MITARDAVAGVASTADQPVGLSASRITRTTRPRTARRSRRGCLTLGRAELAGDPAADDGPEDADDDVRQAAAGVGRRRPPDRAPRGTDDDPADRSSSGRLHPESARNRDRATNARVRVVGGVRAPAITTSAVGSRASSARAPRRTAALSPPRIWRPGVGPRRGLERRSASLPELAERRADGATGGQIGLRGSRELGCGIPTISRRTSPAPRHGRRLDGRSSHAATAGSPRRPAGDGAPS